ncbi:MAG TPA: terminase small subunit [Actinomycetota bacterium]|nr:terminase small subunit [Actinomycetota bacterium]
MNERQQRFVERYLLHLNASKAALEIGCKPCSARASGWKYRHHPKVAAAIEARMAERAQRLRVSAERVVEELARLAFSDIGNIAQWGTGSLTLKPNDDVAIDDRVAIAELSLDQGKGKSRRTRIKLHDKQRALETLARHLGLFDGRGGSMTADEIVEQREKVRALLLERIRKLREQAAEDPASVSPEGAMVVEAFGGPVMARDAEAETGEGEDEEETSDEI